VNVTSYAKISITKIPVKLLKYERWTGHIVKQVANTGSVKRTAGSGQPRLSRTANNNAAVAVL